MQRIINSIGWPAGTMTAGFSIYTLIEKATPVLSFVGLVLGIIVSTLAAIKYIRDLKTNKKTTNGQIR